MNSKNNPMNISTFNRTYASRTPKNLYITLNNRLYLVNNKDYKFIGFKSSIGGNSSKNLRKLWEKNWLAEIKIQREIEKSKNNNLS